MHEEMFFIFVIIIALTIFSAGIAVGNYTVSNMIKDSICQQLNAETIGYLSCQDKQLNKIIKEIKSER